jgi:hypothetical protein
LLLASALTLVPVHALATPKILSISETVHAQETDRFGNVVRNSAFKPAAPTGTTVRVDLGDGLDAFGEPAFAEAFAALPNGVPSFWVSLSSDSSLLPPLHGNGQASVEILFTAVKRSSGDTIVMHVDGGLLQLVDQDFGRDPLSARASLSSRVSTATSAVDHLFEEWIFGNGGPSSPGHSISIQAGCQQISPCRASATTSLARLHKFQASISP